MGGENAKNENFPIWLPRRLVRTNRHARARHFVSLNTSKCLSSLDKCHLNVKWERIMFLKRDLIICGLLLALGTGKLYFAKQTYFDASRF